MPNGWTRSQLEELFYQAMLQDPNSEGWTAERLRHVAKRAVNGAFPQPQGQQGSEAGCYG